MKILESTPTRLTLAMGLRWFNWSRCSFDKSTGRARIERVMFFWPCKPIEVPLSDIEDVRVAVSVTRVEGSDVEKEYPEVRFKDGKPLALPCVTINSTSARTAVKEMRSFLGFEAAGTATSSSSTPFTGR